MKTRRENILESSTSESDIVLLQRESDSVCMGKWIFCKNRVNTKAADALALCIARSLAAMILTMYYRQVHINRSVQERRNSIAKALELRLSLHQPIYIIYKGGHFS